MILSGNSLDHALVAFGALYAGIPFCPVSPAYSLVSKDYGKLAYLMKLLTPGLVFVDDAGVFADALVANVTDDVRDRRVARRRCLAATITMLADLLATPERADIDAVHDAIGPDTIAKFLCTSGSTGNPKAVINTQRMLCANQVMIRETLAFLKDEPPVIVDWLPWNHTFGGNHNIGLTLYNGGSMYLDEGKPTPAGIHETIAICARFRRRSISTCRRATSRCCPICATMRRCARNSSRGCMRCSSPARRCRRISGTVSTSCRCRRPVCGCRC